MSDSALLKFHLGPVQSFIESARTVRDLWTGSYLLSWLVATAIRYVRDNGGTILSPAVEVNPIVNLDKSSAKILTPCLPNHFEAKVRADKADDIAKECREVCSKEWGRIATAVHGRLADKFGATSSNWDRDWKSQFESYFEMRTVVLPPSNESDKIRMGQLHQLMDAARQVKHTPRYVPKLDGDWFGAKCSVMGSFEQVGPAHFQVSASYWTERAGWGFDGTKLRERERFCAISLIKRFAWPADLKATTGRQLEDLRFSDTATAAAREWLRAVDIDPDQIRRQHKSWSGQWLHWRENPPKPEENDDHDEKCPDEVFDAIRAARDRDAKKPVPIYYALLMIDGDNVGTLLSGEGGDQITQLLSKFALNDVEPIVENDHAGELIYSGGDDVLAFMPTTKALACARAIYHRYRHADVMGRFADGTMSGGLVIAHYKEDLRFVLEQARAAEREAKNAGRDRLALRILRRSGEHTTAVLAWPLALEFQKLVDRYVAAGKAKAPSDRWAYKLRAELPALEAASALFKAELTRLLNRLEMPTKDRDEFRDFVLKIHGEYSRAPAGSAKEFVTLCQSASFLARGRDE